MKTYDSSELFFKCTVTSPATTCLVISLKNLDSCKTLIACEFSFVVLLCWFLLHTALELYWTVILLHRILNNNNLVGEIPAQLANCFSLITLYVFCANFVLTAWLVNSPALKHVLFSFQKFVIQQLYWQCVIFFIKSSVPHLVSGISCLKFFCSCNFSTDFWTFSRRTKSNVILSNCSQ